MISNDDLPYEEDPYQVDPWHPLHDRFLSAITVPELPQIKRSVKGLNDTSESSSESKLNSNASSELSVSSDRIFAPNNKASRVKACAMGINTSLTRLNSRHPQTDGNIGDLLGEDPPSDTNSDPGPPKVHQAEKNTSRKTKRVENSCSRKDSSAMQSLSDSESEKVRKLKSRTDTLTDRAARRAQQPRPAHGFRIGGFGGLAARMMRWFLILNVCSLAFVNGGPPPPKLERYKRSVSQQDSSTDGDTRMYLTLANGTRVDYETYMEKFHQKMMSNDSLGH